MGTPGTAGIFPHAAIPVSLPAVSVLRLPLSPVTRVLSREVRITGAEGHDYVCLTDIARYKDPERTDYLIFNWLRNRNTIDFLGIWEQINNPGFNPVEWVIASHLQVICGYVSYTLCHNRAASPERKILPSLKIIHVPTTSQNLIALQHE
jgi:hypothetical protein